VYAPELDPINVQKQPRLRLPQAAASADLESGTDLNPSNAAPSTLQVPYLKRNFSFSQVFKIHVHESTVAVMLAEMYKIFTFSQKCGNRRFRSFSQRKRKGAWLKFLCKQRL
jgi:hypothetical protein